MAMKDGLFAQNPEYHEGTFIEDTDDLRHFLYELMYRLKDSKDYADYLEPKFESVYEMLDEIGDHGRKYE
jgi:hypothetical protein